MIGSSVIYRPVTGGAFAGIVTGATKKGRLWVQIAGSVPRQVLTTPERLRPAEEMACLEAEMALGSIVTAGQVGREGAE